MDLEQDIDPDSIFFFVIKAIAVFIKIIINITEVNSDININ